MKLKHFLRFLIAAENILSNLPNNTTENLSYKNVKAAAFNILDSPHKRVGVKRAGSLKKKKRKAFKIFEISIFIFCK